MEVFCGKSRTKKQIETYCRSVLADNVGKKEESLTTPLGQMLHALVLRHHNAEGLMKDWHSFHLNAAPRGKGVELSVCDKSGRQQTFSWINAVKKPSESQRTHSALRGAMRTAIMPEVQRFKHRHEGEACTLCGDTTREQHADHILHFERIVTDFLALPDTPAAPSQFAEETAGVHGKVFLPKDKAWADKWSAYHASISANLRITCESCNLRRKKAKM
jgi:5-methylcytosine-specific restriction endonuclease McrA